MAMAAIALVGWLAWMWREGRTLTETLQWAGLENVIREEPRTERAATLLEVVDVGGVYERQLKLVLQAGTGLNPSLDKGRSKAMRNLKEQAGTPLHQQIDLFVKLANDGIQQGSRPDRETQRMRSLAAQGVVLGQEMARLELAWHSLAAAVFWTDLPRLTDQQVAARLDSLSRRENGFLEDARLGLGTTDVAEALDQARAQVQGMASLLSLFNEKSYSPEWEKALTVAAAKVSPAASRMTRAYRNGAFAFARLKKAERSGASAALPFVGDLEDNAWPSAEVRSILPTLRSQTNMFAKGQAPVLLTATLDLYGVLKNPLEAAAQAARSPDFLTDLEKNAALRFDRPAYAGFLERIRFEAAGILLADLSNPGDLPAYLYAADDLESVLTFRDAWAASTAPESWHTVREDIGQEFLVDWAGRLAVASRLELERLQAAFDRDWAECGLAVDRLRQEVRQGTDWAVTWALVEERAAAMRAAYGERLAGDPERAGRLEQLAGLQGALYAPVMLVVENVTVRLDQDLLAEPTRVRVEIATGPGGQTRVSDDFKVGPGAPRGSGWVGTGPVAWKTQVTAAQSIRVRVLTKDGKTTLLEVDCPALHQGPGIGGMLRPRRGEQGSVSLKIRDDFWTGLRVPDLGPVF
jgi:hypothetical protein